MPSLQLDDIPSTYADVDDLGRDAGFEATNTIEAGREPPAAPAAPRSSVIVGRRATPGERAVPPRVSGPAWILVAD